MAHYFMGHKSKGYRSYSIGHSTHNAGEAQATMTPALRSACLPAKIGGVRIVRIKLNVAVFADQDHGQTRATKATMSFHLRTQKIEPRSILRHLFFSLCVHACGWYAKAGAAGRETHVRKREHRPRACSGTAAVDVEQGGIGLALACARPFCGPRRISFPSPEPHSRNETYFSCC